jgi:hypothetical protein
MKPVSAYKFASFNSIKGLEATHTVTITTQVMTMQKWAAETRLKYWRPESGTGDFTTPGRALGWIKRMIVGKAGWPNPTQWEIWMNLDECTFSVYKVKDAQGL